MSPPSGTSAPTGSGRSRPADQGTRGWWSRARAQTGAYVPSSAVISPTAGSGSVRPSAVRSGAQRLFDDLVRVALKEARLQHTGQTFDSGMQSKRNLRELRVEHEKP